MGYKYEFKNGEYNCQHVSNIYLTNSYIYRFIFGRSTIQQTINQQFYCDKRYFIFKYPFSALSKKFWIFAISNNESLSNQNYIFYRNIIIKAIFYFYIGPEFKSTIIDLLRFRRQYSDNQSLIQLFSYILAQIYVFNFHPAVANSDQYIGPSSLTASENRLVKKFLRIH